MPSPSFQAALPFILRWEGGFVDHPADPGGRTNRGVTQRVYDQWRAGQGLPPRDVKVIEDAEVEAIYEAGEAPRRAVGWPLVIVTGTFIVYGFFGPYFPGIFAHRGYSFRRIVDHLYLTSEGIFGIPLWVSSTFVYAFVLFGAIFERTGAGEYLMKLAKSLVGHTRGGPAKVSVVASAFMGTISGSGVANTATIGTLTIPLMKKVGFKPELAGGIDTAAGGNGQLMPPLMGAAAFVMAEFLGIPYLDACVAAALPAVIDQLALLGAVHLLATKYGFKGVPRAQLPKFFPTLVSGLHFLVPSAPSSFILRAM